MKRTRRKFLKDSGQIALGIGLIGWAACNDSSQSAMTEEEKAAIINANDSNLFFKISLAQWSLHRNIQSGKMDHLDFAATAKKKFGISAIEYVSQFFMDKAKDNNYLNDMKFRAMDNGVEQLLIMVDGEGGLAETDNRKRNQAVDNHYKWVDAAKFLGCKAIRVNAHTDSKVMEDAHKAAVHGIGKLGEYARFLEIDVIVENHGGFSSNAKWLTGVLKEINESNIGTLPDFGNFCINGNPDPNVDECELWYDRYQGVAEMMPYAFAVSAKSNDFDSKGNEKHTDYAKMLKIIKDAGYKDYIGIEYEGDSLGEEDGILATKNLLIKTGTGL
jgi:sugar phosphate isomerase/epimerase